MKLPRLQNNIVEEEINFFRFKSEILKSLLQIILLFIFSVYLVYYSQPIVRDLAFLVILALFWISKKNYFWFAFFFILINGPAYFFADYAMESPFRLPFYTIAAGMSFNLFDLFVILAFIKAFMYPTNNYPLKIINSLFPFIIIAFLIGFLVAIWYGITLGEFLNNFRTFFYITLLFSFWRLLNDKSDLIKFGYLLIPAVVLVFAHQTYFAATGKLIISFFDPAYVDVLMMNTISKQARPELTGPLIFFYSLGFGFLLSRNKKYEIFPAFSTLFITLVIVSIFLSATRTWITISILMIFVHLIFTRKLAQSLVFLPYVAVIIFVFLAMLNFLDYFIVNIWTRYYTFLDSLFSNQLTAYDTVVPRLEKSLPKILSGIEESPIVGLGFSTELKKYYDVDLGGLNTVLTFGIVGTVMFFITYYHILKKIFLYSKNSSDPLTVTIMQSVLTIFAGIFLGFFTTWDFFSFLVGSKVFFISVILTHAEIAARDDFDTAEEESAETDINEKTAKKLQKVFN